MASKRTRESPVALNKLYPLTLPLYSLIHPGRIFQILVPSGRGWKVVKPFKQSSLHIPTLNESLLGNKRDYGEKMRAKYTLNEFIDIEEGDTVVDVGAFVGGFSRGCNGIAKRILAIEPVQSNVECLKKNVGENVDIAECAIWNKTTMINLYLGDPQDHSIFDNSRDGRVVISGNVKVQARRLDSLCKQYGYEDIDFLKLEAEGAEPESLEGLGKLRPNKIAVSCGDEREEENTLPTVQKLLTEMGYKTQLETNMVYGRLIR